MPSSSPAASSPPSDSPRPTTRPSGSASRSPTSTSARRSINRTTLAAVSDESARVTVALHYLRRHYIAARDSLMTVVLDAPDVDYTAIAPGVAARVPVTPTITVLGGLDGMLMLEAGPIQRPPSFG